MTLEFVLFSPHEDLIERRMVLSQMQTIPDMRAYASAWLQLADDFQVCGLLSNAAMCKAKGDYYAEFAGGEYIRLIDGSFAELIAVEVEVA